jgi:hypothetical protein
MGERDAAQAVELVRALRDQLRQMTHQLVWLEHHDATEAAALRLDISQAQVFIYRLQRRYLNRMAAPATLAGGHNVFRSSRSPQGTRTDRC